MSGHCSGCAFQLFDVVFILRTVTPAGLGFGVNGMDVPTLYAVYTSFSSHAPSHLPFISPLSFSLPSAIPSLCLLLFFFALSSMPGARVVWYVRCVVLYCYGAVVPFEQYSYLQLS